jgi:NADH-quinone oxidoreductase subunit N
LSAPLIWIMIPGLAALALYFIRKWEKITTLVGTLIALSLAYLAWKMPIESLFQAGIWYIRIEDTFFILGRRFIIDNADRSVLTALFLAVAFWFGGAYAARVGRSFVPFGLGIAAVLVAALSVEPFLYSALLIQMAALLCIPLLASPGKRAGRGALRFITFQTLGTPFLLFTGWMLTGSEVTPANLSLAIQAGVLLAFGFCFLLAVFPFHSWIPMLTEDTHPYAAAFVFFLLPGLVTLVGLGFLERYVWLRNSQNVYVLLQAGGALMVVSGGLFAAFQKNLGRIMGYAVLVDIGLTLMAVSLSRGIIVPPFLGVKETGISLSMYFYLFLTRGLALGTWALALSHIQAHSGDLSYSAVQGMGRLLPFSAAGVILATFSIAGFPLLAGFPVRLALLENLAQSAPLAVFWAVIGSAGLLIGGIRSLAVLVVGPEDTPWQINENRITILLLSIAIAALIVGGIAPHLLQ